MSKIDLTCLVVYTAEIEAFQKAVKNSTELAYRGNAGARTAVVRSSPANSSPVTSKFDK